MRDAVITGALFYLAAISTVSVFVTISDKLFSKKRNHRRTPEATLMTLSAFGGSAAMLITMLIIRHKTRHVKFMLGIPAIILVQAALIFLSIKYLLPLI